MQRSCRACAVTPVIAASLRWDEHVMLFALLPPAPTEAMMFDHAVAAWARRPRAVFWGCLRPVCLGVRVSLSASTT